MSFPDGTGTSVGDAVAVRGATVAVGVAVCGGGGAPVHKVELMLREAAGKLEPLAAQASTRIRPSGPTAADLLPLLFLTAGTTVRGNEPIPERCGVCSDQNTAARPATPPAVG
jgi:hypothetical protein